MYSECATGVVALQPLGAADRPVRACPLELCVADRGVTGELDANFGEDAVQREVVLLAGVLRSQRPGRRAETSVVRGNNDTLLAELQPHLTVVIGLVGLNAEAAGPGRSFEPDGCSTHRCPLSGD